MPPHRRSCLALILLCAPPPPVAVARERASAELRYTRKAGAQSCPERAALMSAVAVRLGYVPWSPRPDRAVEVVMQRQRRGRGWEARILLRDRSGEVVGRRELRSGARDCRELAAAVELAICLAIDPLSLGGGSPPPPRSRPASRPAEPKKRAQPTKKEEPAVAAQPRRDEPAPADDARTRWRVGLSIGGVLGVGSAPALAGGFTLGLRLRYGWLSLSAEGRADLPASMEVVGGRVSSALYLGGLVPCIHLGHFMGCVLLEAGALRGEGHELELAEAVSLPYVAAGGRLALELPLFFLPLPLSFRVYGDFTGTLTRGNLLDTRTGEAYWSTPPVSGAFGLAILAEP